jgi:predicted nucleic acid-binding protein
MCYYRLKGSSSSKKKNSNMDIVDADKQIENRSKKMANKHKPDKICSLVDCITYILNSSKQTKK